jgi:arsenite methyltransferase
MATLELMATHAPAALDLTKLTDEIVSVYERVATDPGGDFHFHRGPVYAAEHLGYDAAALAELPQASTASFAGVANPHAIAPLREGDTVVDIGSGAGMDLLLAARAVGPTGRAIGVDITEPMRAVANASAAALGLDNVDVRAGDALDLPVDDDSVDVVISNGVINLTPNKVRAFREILRVLKPGGRLQLADIILDAELTESARTDIDLWTG